MHGIDVEEAKKITMADRYVKPGVSQVNTTRQVPMPRLKQNLYTNIVETGYIRQTNFTAFADSHSLAFCNILFLQLGTLLASVRYN